MCTFRLFKGLHAYAGGKTVFTIRIDPKSNRLASKSQENCACWVTVCRGWIRLRPENIRVMIPAGHGARPTPLNHCHLRMRWVLQRWQPARTAGPGRATAPDGLGGPASTECQARRGKIRGAGEREK
jgi:hypothetical protein